jgi:hypothetical protein
MVGVRSPEVSMETSPGLLRVDHDPDRHDDRAVALSFAVVPLVERSAVTGTGTSFSGPPIPRRPADVITTVYPWELPFEDRVRGRG